MKIENKMMTAVQWLFEQLTEVDYKCINKTFLQNNNSLAGFKLRELFEQAKEMEKKQLNDAYNADRPNLTCYEENTAFTEYYNETFNNED